LAPAERAAAFLREVAPPPLAPAFFDDVFERDVLRAPEAFLRDPAALLRELDVLRRVVVVLRPAVFLRELVVLRRTVDVFLRAPVVLRRAAVVFLRPLVVLRPAVDVFLRALDVFFRAAVDLRRDVVVLLRELVAFFRAEPAFLRDELAFFVALRRFTPDRDADDREVAATERDASVSTDGISSPKPLPPDVEPATTPDVEPIDGSSPHDVPASSDSVSERSPVSLQSWVMYDLLFGLRA